jgi:ubiquinone/menaquinone biosynthesis C-methylase UbiE
VDLTPALTSDFRYIDGVYVFIEDSHYSETFGLQWTKYSRTQLDSFNQQSRSQIRFETETGWTENQLRDRVVVDAGCGSGRFSEAALKMGAKVISIDSSRAVFATRKNISSSDSAIIQCDLSRIPLPDNFVDFAFCIGVIQHTSHPERVLSELLRILKPGAELAITFYEKKGFRTLLYSKYIVRSITSRIKPEHLLNLITKTSVFWYPVTKILFSLPHPFGKIMQFLIPIANYVDFQYTTRQDAMDEAILDTFDMLSPRHDRPFTKSEIRKLIHEIGIKTRELESVPNFGTLKFQKLSNLNS